MRMPLYLSSSSKWSTTEQESRDQDVGVQDHVRAFHRLATLALR